MIVYHLKNDLIYHLMPELRCGGGEMEMGLGMTADNSCLNFGRLGFGVSTWRSGGKRLWFCARRNDSILGGQKTGHNLVSSYTGLPQPCIYYKLNDDSK